MAATKRIPIKKSLYKALKYITSAEKTDTEILVTGLNGCSTDPKSAFTQMRFTKQNFEKKDKIQAHHFIQAFDPGEVTPEVAHEIGMKWAKEIFGENFQGILSTHIDKGHIHNHIIINSVSHIDGKKYYSNKDELKLIREKSDELCSEYNLSVIDTEKSKSTGRNKKKSQKEYHDSWKEEQHKKQSTIKEDIDATISESKDFEDFISKMKKQGYEIKYGKNVKYISFKKLGSKTVRGKTIGEEYTEENIRKRIEHKEIEILDLSQYKRQSFSIESGIDKRIITLNKVLLEESYVDKYYTRIPGQKQYIYYSKSDMKVLNEYTFSVNINLNKIYTIYDKNKNAQQISGHELFSFYDDKTNELNNKSNNKSVKYTMDKSQNERNNYSNPYDKKPKKYVCKKTNSFNRNKKYYKKNKFKYGNYRWNYTRPSARNSLLVLLILLKTKKSFDKKKINLSSIKSYNNQRILDNNIKNIQSNLNLLNRYNFNSISDIDTAIKKIEDSKKDNFRKIKLLEENILRKKMIFDMTEDYIKYKPAYRIYKNETGIKTSDSEKFINIYHTLKSLGIDNETKILEYRAAYENTLEDIDNDITDLKEINKNFNKEKHQLDKIRDTVIDMKEKKYNVELDKEELSQKENKYKSFIVNAKDKDENINNRKDKDKER